MRCLVISQDGPRSRNDRDDRQRKPKGSFTQKTEAAGQEHGQRRQQRKTSGIAFDEQRHRGNEAEKHGVKCPLGFEIAHIAEGRESAEKRNGNVEHDFAGALLNHWRYQEGQCSEQGERRARSRPRHDIKGKGRGRDENGAQHQSRRPARSEQQHPQAFDPVICGPPMADADQGIVALIALQIGKGIWQPRRDVIAHEESGNVVGMIVAQEFRIVSVEGALDENGDEQKTQCDGGKLQSRPPPWPSMLDNCCVLGHLLGGSGIWYAGRYAPTIGCRA